MHVLISEKSLRARVGRALRKRGLVLHANRWPGLGRDDLGRYYTVDDDLNCIVDRDIDLARVARELFYRGIGAAAGIE